jgi:hypothetical protein
MYQQEVTSEQIEKMRDIPTTDPELINNWEKVLAFGIVKRDRQPPDNLIVFRWLNGADPEYWCNPQ